MPVAPLHLALLTSALLWLTAPCLAATAGETPDAATDTAEPTFDVWEFQIEGNSLLTATEIERAVYPHLGPARTIVHVEAARTALETLFRDKGYGTVIVDLPEQDVIDGIVLLRVVEGTVERLRISGSRYFSLGRIKSYVPSLAEGEVPHLPTVQKELATLNQANRDRVITPVLRPGKAAGTLEVDLKVDDELPLHASVELNDRYTLNTERLRLNAEVSYSNLWQKEHTISAAYQVAPENRENVEVFSTTYSFRLPDSDKLITLYGVKTSSNVAAIGTLGVVGDGIIAGFRGTLPLPSLDGYFHSFTVGGDYKDFGESIELLGADSLNTPISYVSWSALYNGVSIAEHGTTELSLGVTFALRDLGNTLKEFQNRRFLAKPNFAIVSGSLTRQQPLPYGFELVGAMNGQVADSPLISNEQFSMGGFKSVRGYLESQQFVDDGVRGSLELRTPNLGDWLPEMALWNPLNDFRIHLFVEGATGRVLEPLPLQDESFSLWSAGLGFRVLAFRDFEAEFDWALPFRSGGVIERSPLTGDPLSFAVDDGESRVHFRMKYGF